MKRSLFRYIAPEHADALVRKGEVLFRALSYYRDYEKDGVRSDEFEGTRAHLPLDGLKLTKVETGEVISVPYMFESTVREKDIFVYCLSSELCKELALKFQTDTCVEIIEPGKFFGLIRNALARRPSIKNKHLEHGPVNYYEPHEPPLVDWALPERVVLSKPSSFNWQDEYRIAFGVNGAFDVENVQVRLAPLGERQWSRTSNHPSLLLKLGSLSKICKIHHL